MKKWTVMLIPQGQGGTSSLTLYEFHFWSVCGFVLLLAFTAAFFFQRHQEISRQADVLRQTNRQLEIANADAKAAPPVEAPKPAIDRDEIRQMETRLRSEYEASILAITTELSDLYDMETRARSITGLAPRTPPAIDSSLSKERGKGSGPSNTGPFPYVNENEIGRPPQIIYGMARPSADLIVEEIRLRKRSLGELVKDMEVQIARIERVPAGWPLAKGKGRIESNFGYRRDPFTRRVRHHDGTDISAKKGTPVRATARGKVIKAQYVSEYGNMVIIDHGDGIATAYAHLSDINVKQGQTLGRGDILGAVGSTGRSTGPHLHYEVHVNGRNVNPSKYLSE